MRAWLLIGSAIAALAVGGSAIVSTGDAARQPRPPRVVGFDVSVTFSLLYHIEWRLKQGRRETCSSWRDDAGTADLFAHNTGSDERRPRLKPLQGRYFPSLASIVPRGVPIPRNSIPDTWAEMNVLGPAKGAATRLWIQNGGPATTPCNGQSVTPWTPTPDDCGRREFTLPTKNPTIIRAEVRRPGSDLASLTSRDARTSGQPRPVLSVSVPLFRPFAKCAFPNGPPEGIVGLGIPVPADKVRALRNLGRNKTVRIEPRLAGSCDDELDREDPTHEFGYCRYSVRGWIAIRRIERNPYRR
jgi:hypothetical protein